VTTYRRRREHTSHGTSQLPSAFATVVVLTLVAALILAVAMSDRIAVAIGDRSGRFNTASLTHPEPILIDTVDGPPFVLGAAVDVVSDSTTSAGGSRTARTGSPAPRIQPGALSAERGPIAPAEAGSAAPSTSAGRTPPATTLPTTGPATTTGSTAPTTTVPVTTTTPTTSATTTRTATTTTTTTRPQRGLGLCAVPGVDLLLCH
jgi:hypothetical protein